MFPLPTQTEYTHDELIHLLQNLVKVAGSQKALADELRISPQYLGDVLRGRREPGEAILSRLGLEKRIYYVRVSDERD
jgi:transcriptional regulator with XRE-family HTH domain